jgi:surface polysaccharide O-acyltransferase-like enzyme
VLTFATKWAVPVFVMVSGALVLRPPRDPSPGAFYRKRISRIGIPLVFWHVVYALLLASLRRDVDWQFAVSQTLIGELYTALYFFWLILGLYLVTPLLWPVIAGWSGRGVLIAGALLTAAPALDLVIRRLTAVLGHPARAGDPTIVTQFVPYVGFFVLGSVLRDRVVRGWALVALTGGVTAGLILITLQAAYPELLGAAGPALQVINPISYQGPLLGLVSVGVYLIVRSVVNPRSGLARDPWQSAARRLGDLTFGVFGCHLLVSYLIARLSGHSVGFGASTTIGIVGQNIAVIAVSFGVTAVAARVPILRKAFGFA